MGVRRAREGVGREHHHEVDAERAPFDHAQRRDGGGDVAAEHVDGDLVAEPQAEPVGDPLVEGHQGLAAVIRRPPFAGGEVRSFRHLGRVGDAAVAFEHPGDLLVGLDLGDRRAAQGDEPAAHHRHAVDTGAGGPALQEFVEGPGFRVGDVEEEEARRPVGQGLHELPGEVRVDERQGHEKRDAEAERQDERGRQRARPMDVGEREARRRGARARQAARQRHEADRHDPQEQEGARGRRR